MIWRRSQRELKVRAAIASAVRAQPELIWPLGRGQTGLQLELLGENDPMLTAGDGAWAGRIRCWGDRMELPVQALLDEPPIAERSFDAIVICHLHQNLEVIKRDRFFGLVFQWLKGGGSLMVLGRRRVGPASLLRTAFSVRHAGFEWVGATPVPLSAFGRKRCRQLPNPLAAAFAGAYCLHARRPDDPGTIIDMRRMIARRRLTVGKPVATRVGRVSDCG